jgi:hypothetical protein
VFGRTNVHRSIDQNVEPQTAPGAKLKRANAAFRSVVEDDATHATRGTHITRQLRQRPSIQVHSVNPHGGQ